MVIQRPPATTALVEPSAPMWAQRMILKLLGFFQAVTPTAPNMLWRCNKADLPPATEWAGCVVIVPDQNALAISNGGQWLKISTAGPI